MPNILIDHTVEDYETWKPYFDDHASTRKEHGSQGFRIFRSDDDPTRVVILFEWDSLDNARAFAADPELRELMAEAGVVGEPTISFLDEVESAPSEPTAV